MRKEKEIKSSLVNFQIRGVEVINNSFVLPPSPPIGKQGRSCKQTDSSYCSC